MIIQQNFDLKIVVYDDIINNVLNIGNYIRSEIQEKYINKPLKKYIPLEIIHIEYFYPKKNPDRVENNRHFTISVYLTAWCLRLFVNEIVHNFVLDSNSTFEEFLLLHKKIANNIRIVGIDLNTSQKYSPSNNSCKILKVQIFERINYTAINCIVEKVAYPYTHYFKPTEVTHSLSIDKKYKFNINKKEMNIDDLYNYINTTLSTHNELIMTFVDKKNITIEPTKHTHTIAVKGKSHFDTILIELYNLTIKD